MRTIKLEVTQDFFDSGQIQTERWFFCDDTHNENGPAYRRWDVDGQLRAENYYAYGQLHNEKDAAVLEWDGGGNLIVIEYWLEGKEHSKAEWEKKVNGTPANKRVTLDGKEYELVPV